MDYGLFLVRSWNRFTDSGVPHQPDHVWKIGAIPLLVCQKEKKKKKTERKETTEILNNKITALFFQIISD